MPQRRSKQFERAGQALRATWRRVRAAPRWVREHTSARTRWIAATVAAGVIALGGGLAWGVWANICSDCPSIAQIYAFEPKEATRVYAADGSLLHEFAVERRTAVAYADIPEHVIDVFVSVEDRRFWDHGGIDLLRSARALLDFLIGGYGSPGGSTITQQLAGNMFSGAVNRRDISVARKLREMRVARSLEQAFTKEEILEAYLNQINFDGVYGIQSAAQYYFDKNAAELNLPEAAMLAAMPRAPRAYNPIRNPERALGRRNLVIGVMERQGKLAPDEAAAARAYPLLVRGGARGDEPAPYFVEWVRQIMLDRYGMRLYEDGLKIYTTLDRDMQAVADSAVQAQLEWVERQPGFAAPTYAETRDWPAEELEATNMPYLQGMFIAIDPRTGNVLAMVGGRDFEESEYNRAVQAARQAGSGFKPFVYTAAIESGIPASEIIYDTPIEYPQPDGTIWSPRNFTGRFLGPITLRDALTASVNIVAVKVGQQVGIEAVAQTAHRMGISTEIPRVPSTAIGSASVRPIEMAEAYTTFANLGVRATARPILRVESARGEVLWDAPVEREEVLDEETAWIMVSMLEDVVNRGSGIRVRTQGNVPREIPVAGKTGTTNDLYDTWFHGFTPNLVTASWVGFDRPARIRRDAQGGQDAAPINAAVLRWFYERNPAPEPWRRPDALVDAAVDRTSGRLATAWCPAELVYTEHYRPGTEPREECDVHGPWGTLREPGDTEADTAAAPITDDFEF
ncbi:MAG TPA: PBP1A family penicillin-binding protein [Gemmatimonadota bacterium]|nr:PBP1A family penicillin-binding protein [Gemmatimonadota bacterium]